MDRLRAHGDCRSGSPHGLLELVCSRSSPDPLGGSARELASVANPRQRRRERCGQLRQLSQSGWPRSLEDPQDSRPFVSRPAEVQGARVGNRDDPSAAESNAREERPVRIVGRERPPDEAENAVLVLDEDEGSRRIERACIYEYS